MTFLTNLSPRRRLLLAGAALLLVLALVAVVVVVVRGGSSEEPVAQATPGPILLVPGYGGGITELESLATRLRATGRTATVVPLPSNGTGDLHLQAKVLDVAARAAMAGGATSVDVVGFSAGGVVARLWAREDGGANRARRIVTLGAPQHGTDLAELAGALVPGACPPACRQLAPGSDVMSALNSGDETPDGPQWVSIWTSQDQVVSPPDSARLDGARNVVVQQVCPGRSVAHGQLPGDAVVQGLVLRALGAALFTLPAPADCAALGGT